LTGAEDGGQPRVICAFLVERDRPGGAKYDLAARPGCTCRAQIPVQKAGFTRRQGKIARDVDSPLEGDGFEPSVPHRAARRCSAKKRRSSHIPPISARLPLEQEPRSWVTTDACVTRRRDRRASKASAIRLILRPAVGLGSACR
jgi:hypothetical protein